MKLLPGKPYYALAFPSLVKRGFSEHETSTVVSRLLWVVQVGIASVFVGPDDFRRVMDRLNVRLWIDDRMFLNVPAGYLSRSGHELTMRQELELRPGQVVRVALGAGSPGKRVWPRRNTPVTVVLQCRCL